MNPPISSNFYSICQGTHPAKTNLCRNSPTKGARNIGSAQAQELIGSNDLVTCLEAKHEKSQTIEILILSESFRLWSGCRKKNSLKKLQTFENKNNTSQLSSLCHFKWKDYFILCSLKKNLVVLLNSEVLSCFCAIIMCTTHINSYQLI